MTLLLQLLPLREAFNVIKLVPLAFAVLAGKCSALRGSHIASIITLAYLSPAYFEKRVAAFKVTQLVTLAIARVKPHLYAARTVPLRLLFIAMKWLGPMGLAVK